MEEAASLFGPADPSLDPFGTLVGNGSDDLGDRTTFHPNEPPPPEVQEVDSGGGWYNGESGHYQSQGSVHPEYSWQSGDAAAGHYQSQPRYGGSTSPSSLAYHQQLSPHEGEQSQYLASHDAGHVYHTQQHYKPSTAQVPFERNSISQSGGNLPGDSASSALHTRAAHAQPAFDAYRPIVQQPTNVGSSSMFSDLPLSPPHDRSAVYSPYQPISSGASSVPQSGYQAYSVPVNPPPPQAVHASLGSQVNPPDPSRATALYRPKTSNAYDPPIPPPKPTRLPSVAAGSSRVVSPTSVAQGYAPQGARHVAQHTNAAPQSLPDRYAAQAPTPLVSRLVASTSPPRGDSHVPRSSVPPGHSVGAPHYSTTQGLDPPYPHRNTLGHTSLHNALSNGPAAEDTLIDELGYPVTASGDSGTFNDRTIRPNQRGERTERKHSLNTSLSGNPYDPSDTGGRPVTNNGYSREVSRSPPIHTGKYGLSGYTPTLERSQSPSGSSVRSSRSSRRDLVSPPKFSGSVPHLPVSAGPSTDPKPLVSRDSSPASIRSWKSPPVSSHDPYAPVRTMGPSMSARDRSMSNSSFVSHSSVTSDPYAPSRRSQNPSEASIPGLAHHTSGVPVHDIDRSHGGQTLTYPAQTHPPYAPSPSLLGSNDPLGRTSSRAPVFSFGFGGKLVLCFHGSNTLNTGFDIALSSRQTTGIQLRPLHAVIPESALDHISTSFPGPLFCDPGSPTGLVRAAAATQSKSNKAKVIKYLEERSEEISRGLGYLSQGSAERRQAEAKHVLVRLLKVLLEHDGHLSGSPQVEASVRAILVPRISDASGLEQSTTSPKATSYGLDGAMSLAPLGFSTFDPHDRVLSVHTVRSSALDKIQDLLARGERTAAYRYALDERLWAHAMVIASSIDKDAWKEVVNDFIRSELSSQVSVDGTGPNQREVTPGTGREPLKVAYGLYSGQGAASIQGLVPPISLNKGGEMLHAPTLPQLTPISSNPLSHTTTVPIHADVLCEWPVTAAMLIPGPSVSECSAALVALGDSLLANQWVEAAHACYLLAPQSSMLGTIGSPGRVPLLGSRGPTAVPNFHVDDDAIVLSEIAEFALSLAPPSKGQEPFIGLLNLQPYKLLRAVSLAEMGHVLAANRYCEAITACLSRAPTGSYLDLAEQLRELNDRLVGAPLDKTGSWIGGKMSRPSLDSFGNWLGGRLTDFVAGGEEPPTENGDITPHENKAFAGPFSHFSTISSSTTSKAPSPQPCVVDYNVLVDAESKLRRTGSAQAFRLNPHVQIDRASSAMEYRPVQRIPSPAPRIVSASAATTYFPHTSSSNNGYPRAGTSSGAYQQPESESPYAGTWWGSSGTEESSTTTPTASMFPNGRPSSPSGFVSLMDGPPMPAVPTSGSLLRSSTLTTTHDDDDDDELGLGNSSGKPKASSNDSGVGNDAAPDRKVEQTSLQSRPGAKPNQQSSSWFSRWWSREGSSGPIKATLGEESSFVFDKELKRWVNKKAGAEATKPAAPPPPPSRAQTVSPSHTSPRILTSTTRAPPTARAASAIDLSASPPKRMQSRPRSTLAGENNTNGVLPSPGLTASPPPVPSGSPTPPPSRPRSQATKRNLRSRYVDVFQQPTVGT